MKFKFSSFVVVCFLLFPLCIKAQDKSISYYDYYFNKTSKKKFAFYFSNCVPIEDGGVLEEIRNIRTNRIAAIKTYKSSKKKILHGRFELYNVNKKVIERGTYLNGEKSGKWEYFYNDGILNRTEFYSENGLLDGEYVVYGFSGDTLIYGTYKDDLKVGKWLVFNSFSELKESSNYNENGKLEGLNIIYFENGDTSRFGHYFNGKKIGEWISRHENGTLMEKSYYLEGGEETGVWERYYEDKSLMSKGTYSEGELNGEWIWYHSNGQASSIESYKNGELLEFQFYNEQGKEVNYSDVPYRVPEFPGGMNELFKYLGKNINYPPIAQENGIQGRVVLRFVIEPDGTIKDVEVLKAIGGGCDEESIRVVEEMPKWEKGIQHNLQIDTYYTLPIKFTLN